MPGQPESQDHKVALYIRLHTETSLRLQYVNQRQHADAVQKHGDSMAIVSGYDQTASQTTDCITDKHETLQSRASVA